jgi:hypothetical protein
LSEEQGQRLPMLTHISDRFTQAAVNPSYAVRRPDQRL